MSEVLLLSFACAYIMCVCVCVCVCLCVSVSVSVSAEVMVKVHVVDLKDDTIVPPISVRAYLNQSIMEFKQLIAQVASVLFPISQ